MLEDPHIVGLIASELAKWHSIKFPADLHSDLWETIHGFAAKGTCVGPLAPPFAM